MLLAQAIEVLTGEPKEPLFNVRKEPEPEKAEEKKSEPVAVGPGGAAKAMVHAAAAPKASEGDETK